MSMDRTFYVCCRFGFEVDMPRSWPDEAVYDLKIQVVDGEGNCVFIHPERMPVFYDRFEKTYKNMEEMVSSNLCRY